MYPNLYFAFKDLFHVDLPFLKIINTFGFFVALSFLAGAWALVAELKRKQSQGLLVYTKEKRIIGAPASAGDLIINFLLGFVFGYKILGAFITKEALADPQSFILSGQGNWPAGIILGLVAAGLKWIEKNKTKLAKPEERMIRIWPHDRVGDMIIIAAIVGFLGAKIFDNLEHWDRFVKDPVGELLAFSGLTFYGGLICATIAITWYAIKHKITVIHLADSFAPAMMLAYAVGRIGCHMAGDGDWGILNSAYISTADGHVFAATADQFSAALSANHGYYINEFGSMDAVQHLHITAPGWLPQWLVAYNYPHNVNNAGMPLAGCTGNYCHGLPISVFPTAFYEVITCLILFFILWMLRKRIKVAGYITSIYLILNGLERFTVEKIRVNSRYDFWGIHPTQAEIISFFLILAGIALFIYSYKNKGRWVAAKPEPVVVNEITE